MSSSIYKLVDYSESESEEFIEETCVGKRGRRSKKSKKIVNRRDGPVAKEVKSNPCLGKKCPNQCSHKFSELDRKNINEFYWGLASDTRQKDYLYSCIEQIIGSKSRSVLKRRAAYRYFINFQGERTKVCQQFLINTIGISQMTLRHSILKKVQNSNQTTSKKGMLTTKLINRIWI